MLIDFFYLLKEAGLPVSTTEYLALLEALDKRVVTTSIDDFYYLARTVLIKDEKHYDKFDRVFGAYFKGIEDIAALLAQAVKEAQIPPEWLAKRHELNLSEQEMAAIE